MLQLVALLMLSAQCPTLTEAAPAWMVAFAGTALLAYATLDNMDGKQARRTGSSSPLGLLFDHGCDCLNAGITGPLIMHAAFGVPPGSWHFIGIWLLPSIPFFFNTYEEFHIGRFVLPLVNGPNEGLAMLISCYYLTAVYGQGMWALPVVFQPVAAMVTAAAPLLWAIRTAAGVPTDSVTTNLDALMLLTAVVAIPTVAANSLAAVRAVLRGGGSHWDAVGALAHQTPLWAVAALACGWCYGPPATVALVAGHPYLFIGTLGAFFATATSQLMVAHAAGDDFAPAFFPLIPLVWPLAGAVAAQWG